MSTKPAGFVPVLYRAPQVRQAVEAGQPVWLMEGEKDVETAERALGVVATTNTQGGRSFPAALVGELGPDVHVVLDRDATGWARGVDLHGKLTAAGAAVHLWLPAVTAAKADLTDHVEAGFGVADLVSVHLEEVAAWDALAGAEAKCDDLEKAAGQARARLELAGQAQQQDSDREHRRHAHRWALETQIRHEALHDLVNRVHCHGLKVGTEWAGAGHADRR